MIKGADISKYQGDIDWNIYKQNLDFVIMKATEGDGYTDPKFFANQLNARVAGLPLGYYHFARPDLANTAEAEADYFLGIISNPVENEVYCLDFEPNWSGDAVGWCKGFLDRVQSKIGVKCFIYLNQAQIKKYDWSPIINGGYPLWIAAYTGSPTITNYTLGQWSKATIHQWTNSLTTPGINGAVDGDSFSGTIDEFRRFGWHKLGQYANMNHMVISLPLFSQRDDRWKANKLGTSAITLGTAGCLDTVLAMICKYYGKDTDPARMNQDLIRVAGFSDGNLYIWNSIHRIYSDIAETKNVDTSAAAVTTAQFNEMKAEIDAGRPIICEVDFIPATASVDMHFVCIIGYTDTDWIMADPWYGDTASLTRYGVPAKTIQKYVLTSGPLPIINPSAGLPDSQRISLGLLVDSWGALPDTDVNKGNLESYTRAMLDQYLKYPDLESKAKRLDGLLAKWITAWQLPSTAGQHEVEDEMAKLMPAEELRDEYRDAIVAVTGPFDDNTALFQALGAVKTEIDTKTKRITTLEKKLEQAGVPDGYEFQKSWKLFSLMWMLYKYKKVG